MVAILALLPLTGGLFLGWTLGANDAANVFGTAVGSRIITFRKATIVCGVFVVLGAMMQGTAGMETLSGLTHLTIATAVVVSVSAAISGTIMTYLRLPISTSQAVVGSILGVCLAKKEYDFAPLVKVLACWIGTPIGSMIIACVIYKLMAVFFRFVPVSLFARDKLLWAGLLVVGAYGSYALGANNVANTTGIFKGLFDGVNDRALAAIGGVAIALGGFTYSKRVMMRVGSGIMRMDAFTALVAVLSMSITVHIFAVVGVPVSTSQGIVGSIFGIGLMRGVHVIRFQALRSIAFGWFLTPTVALVLSAAGYAVFCK